MISFVYFDLGGVIIQDFSDSDKWEIMLQEMGLPLSDIRAVNALYNQYEEEVCVGKKHIDGLLPVYAKKYGLKFPRGFSMQRYFIDHFDPNPGIWPALEKLRKTKRLGLITNNYPNMLEGIFAKKIIPQIEWSAIIDSSIVGARKPEPEIYRIAETRAGVPGEEILFIDNVEKNLPPARALNWQTFHYDSKNYEKANSDLMRYISSL